MYAYVANVIEFDPRRPVWIQVAEALEDRIDRGVYRPGRVLPSEQQLVQEFGIARGTARKVVAFLREQGLIVTVPHLGSFVADDNP